MYMMVYIINEHGQIMYLDLLKHHTRNLVKLNSLFEAFFKKN